MFEKYMRLLFKDKFDEMYNLKNKSRYFIGPSSYTLQIKNIIPHNENMKIPNIRKNYCVTDKADGERRMMYISSNGKIYLIDTSMNITYTGAITKESETFDSLIDGELILHDKYGKFINLFAGFDIYFLNKKDIRSMEFIETYSEKETSSSKQQKEHFRYSLLIKLTKNFILIELKN
jgi:archaellum component FlaF (FlaF/FlaG flagellin family)